MGYVIVAGVGLALGIGLLIWALRERSARHEAEKKSLNAGLKIQRMEEQISKWDASVAKHEQEQARTEGQIATLRQTIENLRERLVTCEDPVAIKRWLDTELGDNDV